MTMKQEKKRIYLRAALGLIALLAVLLALDNLSFVPSMLLTVLRKGAIYALVAVSMNLLNGFTGLFSLGQAGFMLLGAYTYAILTIPAASQKSIYQRYANGGIGFSIPELLSKPLGGFGLLLGVVFCLILAGFIAALFAFLIGLPVLKLKSDYLAIATLGFAEIIRAAVVYEGFGPLTNGSNLLYGFTSFSNFTIPLGGGIGILPSKGLVVAPADATVSVVHSTLHALGLQMEDGTELLIHVGVDTVEMKGDGFESKVKLGSKVTKGQLLLAMDLDKIKAAGHPAVGITVVTNTDDFASVDVVASGNVNPGDDMMKVNK